MESPIRVFPFEPFTESDLIRLVRAHDFGHNKWDLQFKRSFFSPYNRELSTVRLGAVTTFQGAQAKKRVPLGFNPDFRRECRNCPSQNQCICLGEAHPLAWLTRQVILPTDVFWTPKTFSP
jgi:hypothetical protein